jgi:hypothetical protein
MLPAISLLPVAASLTLRFISAVVAPCSSTAEARVSWKSLISPMMPAIPVIAVVAPAVSAWIASTRRAMSSVALAVSWASSLTSFATTARSLPGLAGPGGLDRGVEGQQVRLLRDRGDGLDHLADSLRGDAELAHRPRRLLRGCTAVPATRAASEAFWAISLVEAPISSDPEATVCTLWEIWSAAVATTPARVAASFALLEIDSDEALS